MVHGNCSFIWVAPGEGLEREKKKGFASWDKKKGARPRQAGLAKKTKRT